MARNPLVIVACIGLAIVIGAKFQAFSIALAPIGDLYVGLLKMCVVPMLFSIVALSIMRLMVSQNARRHTIAVLWIFPVLLLATASIATVIGVATHGGTTASSSSHSALGAVVRSAEQPIEVSLYGPPPTPGPSAASQIVASVVPDNVFAAFATGDALKILIFAVIFGVALGALYGSHYHVLYDFLEEIYHAFYQILEWLLLVLPIGLFCIMAASTARVDVRVFTAMGGFVGTFIGVTLVIVTICVFAISRLSGASAIAVIRALRPSAILAFSTRNSFAAMPLAITGLELLHFEEEAVQLLVPLGVSFCRFGSVAYFAFAAFFVSTIYGANGNAMHVLIVAAAAVLAGIASAGTTGIVSLLPLGMVLGGIGLPLDAVLILFIAIDPIIDPFRTTLTLIGGAAAAATAASRSRTVEDVAVAIA